ncbi:MAG: methyltransferase [Candidatus Moraniibacteriota bacterium]
MNTMFEEKMTIDGVTVKCDRIDAAGIELIMPGFPEEQPITWAFAKPYIARLLESDPKMRFVDVGTGSGIFACLVGKHFPKTEIDAVDINKRAIEFTCQNAVTNGIRVNPICGRYSREQFRSHSVNLIAVNAPYHPHPSEVGRFIPFHANAGEDGQEVFREQLSVAGYHLAKDGLIFFNQMATGDTDGPDFLHYIPGLMKAKMSVEWANIFPPIDTLSFLQGVYGERFGSWVRMMAAQKPFLYYTVGIIRNDGKGVIRCLDGQFGKGGINDARLTRSWGSRIALHHEIANHIPREVG